MAICIWGFECARCGDLVLLCTKCLRGRQYCDACAPAKRRLGVRAAGRRYQQTRRGRSNHRRRSRRYRTAHRAGRRPRPEPRAWPEDQPVRALAPPATASVPAAAGEPGAPAAAAAWVTHQSRGPRADDGAKMAGAPTVAALRVTARGAEEPSDAKRGPGPVAAMVARGDVAQAAGGARLVLARCACCGRTGELVWFDGRLAIVRGAAPG